MPSEAEKTKRHLTGPVSSDPANKPQPTGTRPNWRLISKGPLNLTPISMLPKSYLNRNTIQKPESAPPKQAPQLPPDHEVLLTK